MLLQNKGRLQYIGTKVHWLSIWKWQRKKYVSPTFFSDGSNWSFDSHKVIHHFHMTRKFHGYVHNFCNKQVREMTDKKGQYFSCIFDKNYLAFSVVDPEYFTVRKQPPKLKVLKCVKSVRIRSYSGQHFSCVFPYSDWVYCVSRRIQSECGKMREKCWPE